MKEYHSHEEFVNDVCAYMRQNDANHAANIKILKMVHEDIKAIHQRQHESLVLHSDSGVSNLQMLVCMVVFCVLVQTLLLFAHVKKHHAQPLPASGSELQESSTESNAEHVAPVSLPEEAQSSVPRLELYRMELHPVSLSCVGYRHNLVLINCESFLYALDSSDQSQPDESPSSKEYDCKAKRELKLVSKDA